MTQTKMAESELPYMWCEQKSFPS